MLVLCAVLHILTRPVVDVVHRITLLNMRCAGRRRHGCSTTCSCGTTCCITTSLWAKKSVFCLLDLHCRPTLVTSTKSSMSVPTLTLENSFLPGWVSMMNQSSLWICVFALHIIQKISTNKSKRANQPRKPRIIPKAITFCPSFIWPLTICALNWGQTHWVNLTHTIALDLDLQSPVS